MKADHTAQLRLLDLQAADTALAQLRHRRATLPELAAIADREARGSELERDLVDAQTRAGDIAAAQRRLENEVDAVRDRAARDEQRLQTGGVPAKELSGLQHEITTLARRQSTLEDELLEVMEQREQADASAGTLEVRLNALIIERDELITARDAAFADIDAAIAQRAAERAAISGELPPDLRRALRARPRARWWQSAPRAWCSGAATAAASTCPAPSWPPSARRRRTRSCGATTVAASSCAPTNPASERRADQHSGRRRGRRRFAR